MFPASICGDSFVGEEVTGEAAPAESSAFEAGATMVWDVDALSPVVDLASFFDLRRDLDLMLLRSFIVVL